MGSRALSALEPRARGARKLFYINAITMFRLISVSCLVAAACSQFVDPQNAKILKEQRFNAGDGRFGAAFAQEDGTVYREETSADGERVGQYSYIDQEGKTITVRYTASPWPWPRPWTTTTTTSPSTPASTPSSTPTTRPTATSDSTPTVPTSP